MSDREVRSELDGRPEPAALVTTPTGGWLLGWDAALASFYAAHGVDVASGGGVQTDHHLGVTRAAFASPGALEEGLGFPLPTAVRAALGAERDTHPALAAARGMELGVGELPAGPRDVGTFPSWSDTATVAGRPSEAWGLAIERDRDRHAAVVDLGEGSVLEVLGSRPEPASGSDLVDYRLSHGGRVILAGDDVRAPAGVDVSADDSVRALLAVLVDPDPAHRSRLLSAGQRAFLETQGPRLLDAAAGPAAPYPRDTKVAVDVDGQHHRGRVVYPVTARDGQAVAYAWTPDVASLVGHPWRRDGIAGEGEADYTLIAPAAKVTATLAGPEIGAPGPGEALSFGAVVSLAHPDTGERVEATVLRALAGDRDVVYQVEPHTLHNTDTLTVAARDVALVRGTWWPSPAELLAARAAAGLAVVSGELLPGTAVGAAQPGLFAADSPDATQRRAATPEVSAAERDAALLVGLDPKPALVKVDVYGQLARVGDPDHGWLIVPFEQWAAAMAHSGSELRAMLATSDARLALNGNEPVPTLAALAARHTPDRLAGPAATAGGPRHLDADRPPAAWHGLRVVRDHDRPGPGL